MTGIQTFVFEGTEVKKTGRVAIKTLVSRVDKSVKEYALVEITPVDQVFDWKKWVRDDDLYTVKE